MRGQGYEDLVRHRIAGRPTDAERFGRDDVDAAGSTLARDQVVDAAVEDREAAPAGERAGECCEQRMLQREVVRGVFGLLRKRL